MRCQSFWPRERDGLLQSTPTAKRRGWAIAPIWSRRGRLSVVRSHPSVQEGHAEIADGTGGAKPSRRVTAISRHRDIKRSDPNQLSRSELLLLAESFLSSPQPIGAESEG